MTLMLATRLGHYVSTKGIQGFTQLISRGPAASQIKGSRCNPTDIIRSKALDLIVEAADATSRDAPGEPGGRPSP